MILLWVNRNLADTLDILISTKNATLWLDKSHRMTVTQINPVDDHFYVQAMSKGSKPRANAPERVTRWSQLLALITKRSPLTETT